MRQISKLIVAAVEAKMSKNNKKQISIEKQQVSNGLSHHGDVLSNAFEIEVCEFDQESVNEVRRQILNAAASSPSPMKPIILAIDSYGGSVYGALKIIDTIKEIPNPVITMAIGKAMSAGALLLTQGDIRIATPNSKIMIHEVIGGFFGTTSEINTNTSEMNKINDQVLSMIAHKTSFKTLKKLKEWMKKNGPGDIFISPKEAKTLGIIDDIGWPKVQENIVYRIAIKK